MSLGVIVVVVSAALGLAAALVLRTRLPRPAVIALLGAAGAGLGYGGMLLRPDPPVGEWVLAAVGLAIMVPIHAWIVVGPPGRT